jgi:hypothetical protein
MLLWLYTHVPRACSNVSSVSVVYVANVSSLCFKSRSVLHMLQCALVASGTAACRSRLVLLWGRRHGPMVHVQVRDGHDSPGAAAGAPPWFTCGREDVVLDAGMARYAGGERGRDAMRAGVVGCKHGAPSRQALPPERDLAWVEGSCVRRARVWKLRSGRLGASRPINIKPHGKANYSFYRSHEEHNSITHYHRTT